ncbi:MAG TPA: DUF1572 family protein [Thermoanaerobaculia bacterium]|nr:DUF1572 family protein [Thermoanaerobaculia bacterium]
MTELASPTLEAIRVRVTRVLPEQVRRSVDKLTEEQVWWRPNEKSNSVGNLVLHLSGSLNLYLNRLIGGFDYKRDRDGEFAARGPMSKKELLKIFDDMLAKAEKSFDKVTDLMAPATDKEKNDYVIEDLIGIVTHVSTHVGQILWITKALNEGSLDELWMKTHKHEGGWKKR